MSFRVTKMRRVNSSALKHGVLRSVTSPQEARWDLVIAHTLHPRYDSSWLTDVPAVLDTTYLLRELAHRTVL